MPTFANTSTNVRLVVRRLDGDRSRERRMFGVLSERRKHTRPWCCLASRPCGAGSIPQGQPALCSHATSQRLAEVGGFLVVTGATSTYRRQHRHTAGEAGCAQDLELRCRGRSRPAVLRAAREQNIEVVDLVAVERSSTRPSRAGTNPRLRGNLERSTSSGLRCGRGCGQPACMAVSIHAAGTVCTEPPRPRETGSP